MIGQQIVYDFLRDNGISFEYYEHPEAPTIEIAKQYYRGEGTTLCKNLFFRNHKGDKHYLVIIDSSTTMDIHSIEKQLKQGKLSFASAERMQKYLGVKPGSVGLFTLLNDVGHEVILFVDENLLGVKRVSFHPNDNRASIVIGVDSMRAIIETLGNEYRYVKLY